MSQRCKWLQDEALMRPKLNDLDITQKYNQSAFTVFGGSVTTDYYGTTLSPIRDVLPGADRFG